MIAFVFLVILGCELRGACLLSRCCTT
jgi:hypothetical protein